MHVWYTFRGVMAGAAWFKPDMVREDCESLVRKGRTGDFLVRKSGSGKAYTICINDDGSLLSFSLQPTANQQVKSVHCL